MYSCNLKRTMFIVLLKYSPLVQILLYLLSFQNICPNYFLTKKSLRRDIFSSKPYYFITEYFLLSFFLMVMRLFLFKSCLMNHPTSPHVLFELFLMLSEFVPLHKEVLKFNDNRPFWIIQVSLPSFVELLRQQHSGYLSAKFFSRFCNP